MPVVVGGEHYHDGSSLGGNTTALEVVWGGKERTINPPRDNDALLPKNTVSAIDDLRII